LPLRRFAATSVAACYRNGRDFRWQRYLGSLILTFMSTPQDIGTRIRAVRRERGLTQDDLADQVGVSRSAVAQWETGRTGQVTGNLSRIAAALGVAVEYLMVGDDKRAAGEVRQGDELALLRLYRECEPEDRQMLLRTARRLARH
jgi:transcriptional regulator with XRE-family HTH domain